MFCECVICKTRTAFEMVISCAAFGCQNRQRDGSKGGGTDGDQIDSQECENSMGVGDLDGASRPRPVSFHRLVSDC